MKASIFPKICLEQIKYDNGSIWSATDKNLNAIGSSFLSALISRER